MNKKKVNTKKYSDKFHTLGLELVNTVNLIKKEYDTLEDQLGSAEKPLKDLSDTELETMIKIFEKQDPLMNSLRQWGDFIARYNKEGMILHRLYGQYIIRRDFLSEFYDYKKEKNDKKKQEKK